MTDSTPANPNNLNFFERRYRNKEIGLNLSKAIIKRPAFVGAAIEGDQRIGKSSYALKVMREIWGDYDSVLKYTVFSIPEFINKLDEIVKRKIRVPAILWDDLGVAAAAGAYNEEGGAAMVREIKKNIDTIGTVTKALLVTTPDSEDVVKPLRRLRFIKVIVTEDKKQRYGYSGIHYDYRRVATAYQSGRSPKGTPWVSPEFVDVFDVRNVIYERYAKLREKLSIDAIHSGKQYIDSLDAQKLNAIEREEMSRAQKEKEYKLWYHKQRRKGKQRIRKADWEAGYG